MLGIGAGVVGGASLGVPLVDTVLYADDSAPAADTLPRSIIFVVADGMSVGVPSLAEPFSRLVRGRGTNYYKMLKAKQSRSGLVETHSLNSLVTDSAAASTAWASGSRVFNAVLNVLPDGTRMTPIAHLARDAGFRIGLVTTTTITHATPAGFAAVQSNRNAQSDIAGQYLNVVDVMMGGGRNYFDAATRTDRLDLTTRYVKQGYALLDRRDQLSLPSMSDKVLGLFDAGHLPYSIDRKNQPEIEHRVPTLAEMTRSALDTLGRGGSRFLLQVEGGRVDHAAHQNDAAAMLWEQLDFDDALGVVLDHAEEHPDTLVVVTTDHGTSNPGLCGMGSLYSQSTLCLERIAAVTASFYTIDQRLKKLAEGDGAPSRDAVVEVVRGATGIELTATESGAVQRAAAGNHSTVLNSQYRNFQGVLGQVLANHNGIGWTGETHTADYVMITACGPGSELFRGLLPNTDVFDHLTKLMGISYRNPAMKSKQAEKYYAAVTPRELATHWT